MSTISHEFIEQHLRRSDILLAAFQRIIQGRDYYKDLDKADLDHNMDHLFDELDTLRDMMVNDNVDMWDTLHINTTKDQK